MRAVRWFEMFCRNKIKINPDHVCWYDITTLEILLSRSNFKVVETFYHKNQLDVEAADRLDITYKEWMGSKLYVICEKE